MKMLATATFLLLAGTAQAGVTTYYANLAAEAPGATGTGSALATFDDTTHMFTYSAVFSGLSGLTTQAHFHCCTATPFTAAAGVAVDSPTLPIPLGVSAGVFGGALDLHEISNFNAAFVAASGGLPQAIARFKAGMDNGQAYLNIHSTTFLGGEIRGFTHVPEPTTSALGLLALAALGAVGARKRSD